MVSVSLEEENIIKDIRNLFRLENKILKELKIECLEIFRIFFEREEEEKYYKPEGVCNFWRNNYIEYESIDDKSKTLSVEEYLNKIRLYLKKIINNLKKSDT